MNLISQTTNVAFMNRVRLCDTFKGLSIGIVLTLSAEAVLAGSPIGELEYRYSCNIDRRTMPVIYEYRDDAATVSVRGRDRESIELVANENESIRQPVEVVTFEYFSACEQAKNLMREEGDLSKIMENRDKMRRIVFQSDCDAIARMRREGLLRDLEGFGMILEVFSYERIRQDYFGIPFRQRADNIRERCPF